MDSSLNSKANLPQSADNPLNTTKNSNIYESTSGIIGVSDDDSLPLVTIGIPTYNRAGGYLREAIQACLSQTYKNIEIIVSDNCSSDNTEEVVRGYADPRIRYFRQSANIGANDNFNFCVQKARGVYVLILPDDDLIDSDFVEICMKNAKFNKNIGIIRTGMRRIDLNGKIIREEPNYAVGLTTEDFFRTWYEGKIPMHMCMTLLHRENLLKIGGFHSKHNLFQDVLAEVELAAKHGRVDIKEVKASFRMHSSQDTVGAKMRFWCEDSMQLHEKILNLATCDKEVLSVKGRKFFMRHNLQIAKKNRYFFKRIVATLVVIREFGWIYSLKNILPGKI